MHWVSPLNGLKSLNGLLDPVAVVEKLHARFKRHIPLSALTNDACRVAARAGPSRGSLQATDGDNVVRWKTRVLDASREFFLTSLELI